MHAALLVAVLACVALAIAAPEIKLASGTLRGVAGPGFNAYLGIPYALPPLGALRWAPPVPIPNWNTGNATAFKPACPQSGSFFYPAQQDEDCLYLNIWAPDPLPTLGPVPVMVFIHGGVFMQGSGSQPSYWGNYVANTTQMIAVSFNYRLGALGFLSSPILPGNWGILDQQLALRWVHDNIATFGGDPHNVTISGQSAGASAVAIHMVTLQGEGLFQRARMESNPASLIYRKPADSAGYMNALAGFLNCPSDSLACLRAVSWQAVLAAQDRVAYVPFPLNTRDALPWQPALDGALLLDQPINYFARGNFTYVPTIVSTVANESVSFVYEFITSPLSALAYEVLLGGLFPANFTTLFNLYFPDPSDARAALAALTADAYMICPARAIARHMASYGAPVALTSFMYAPPLDPINQSPQCEGRAACHGAELAFTFHSQTFYPGLAWASPQEELLSFRMLNYWTGANDNGVALPAYSPATDLSFAFNLTSGVVRGYHAAACDLWDALLDL